MLDTTERPTARQSERGLTRVVKVLWWATFIGLIIMLFAIIGLTVFTNNSNVSDVAVGDPINSYQANQIQLTRCADPINSCGVNAPINIIPTQAPQSDANLPNNSNDVAVQATPVPIENNPEVEALLDSIFVQVPVPETTENLSSEDRQFFNRANDSTFEASSLFYSVDMNLSVNLPDDAGSIGLNVEGILVNFFDGDDEFDVSALLTITSDLTDPPTNQTTELRIIGDTIYFQDPETLTWLSTSFTDLSNVSLQQQGFQDLGASVDLNLGQVDQIPEILDLFAFGGFVTTERLANQGDEAVFNTTIDVIGFLQSELVDSFIISLTSIMDSMETTSTDVDALRVQTRSFQALVPSLLPRFDLIITRNVSLSTEYLTRIFIDLDTTLQIPDATGNVTSASIAGDISVNLNGHDQNLVVEVPPNAIEITAEQIQQLSAQVPIGTQQP